MIKNSKCVCGAILGAGLGNRGDKTGVRWHGARRGNPDPERVRPALCDSVHVRAQAAASGDRMHAMADEDEEELFDFIGLQHGLFRLYWVPLDRAVFTVTGPRKGLMRRSGR